MESLALRDISCHRRDSTSPGSTAFEKVSGIR